MSGWQIALIVAAVLLLGLVLLPAFNRWQVRYYFFPDELCRICR